MHKFYRSVLLTGMVAVGLAGCGDDVTIVEPPPPPPPPAPTVKSITVAPNPGTVQVGSTITMSAAVVADEGVATTVTWSSSDATKATVNSTSGVVTGVAAGSVAIRAQSTVNPSVQGVATVNVVAAPTATVTGVTVTPGSAALVVGQTVQLSASVQGTNNPAQTVTWSSLSTNIASVSATGLVTGVANGTAVIRGCSTVTGFTNVCGSMSVTVTTPTPAAVSIQSLTQANLGTPVNLANVAGQIEATINVESGAQQLSRVDVLIGGQVMASQSFAVTPAPAEENAAGAPVTVVLSFFTNQLRRTNNLYVPVIFNGPNQVTANLYVVGSSTPLASNAININVRNMDLMLAPTSLTQVATAGPVVVSGTSWFKGNVATAGGNYVSFFPVTPSITWASTGTVACGSTGNMVTGTFSSGIALAGTFTCGSSVENAINLGGYTVVAGTPPAADVFYVAATGFTVVGTAYTVAGENRWNPFAGSAPALANVFIDNKAPVVTPNPIGFLSGNIGLGDAAPNNCEETGITPGCWVGTSYDLMTDFAQVDGGAGVDLATRGIWSRNAALTTPCTSTAFTIAGAAENTSPNTYDICYDVADRLGNMSAKVAGFNMFGVDKTAPTLAYVGGYAVATVNPPVVNVLPATTSASDTLNWSLTDNNSGVDATVGMTVTFTRLLNNGGTPSTTACANPSSTLTGSGTTPQTLASPVLISSCTLPGERTWSATGRDRAGNSAGPIARQLEFNPAVPTINAVNIVPNYAANAAIAVDVLASDDEDLRSGELWGHYTTNTGADIRMVFGPRGGFFSGIWGMSWDNSLFLNTVLGTNSRLSLASSFSLAGYVMNGNNAGMGTALAIDTLSTRVYDTWGAVSTGWVTPLNPAFVTTSSYATTNPWATAPGYAAIMTPSINTVGSTCNFSYATPTNNPEIINRLWVVNDNGAAAGQQVTVLMEISSDPVLVSDNGIQRLYRHSISGTVACANIGGTGVAANNIIAIKSNVGAFLFALLP